MAAHVVAPVEDIPPGSHKLFDVGGRTIVIFNLAGEFFALNNRCPHQGGSLAAGIQTGVVKRAAPGVYEVERKGEYIKCPWHGWTFDVRTGKSWCDPATIGVRQYAARVRHGGEIAEKTYSAEQIPVRVENNYVVVET